MKNLENLGVKKKKGCVVLFMSIEGNRNLKSILQIQISFTEFTQAKKLRTHESTSCDFEKIFLWAKQILPFTFHTHNLK